MGYGLHPGTWAVVSSFDLQPEPAGRLPRRWIPAPCRNHQRGGDTLFLSSGQDARTQREGRYVKGDLRYSLNPLSC